jgi:hypothetical protein
VTDDIHAGRSKYKTAFMVEIKEWYKHKIPNGSAALENLNNNVDINKIWKVSERINIKTSNKYIIQYCSKASMVVQCC